MNGWFITYLILWTMSLGINLANLLSEEVVVVSDKKVASRLAV